MSFAPLLPHVPAFALVLFRLTGIFMVGPVFASQSIPARIKIFLALGLSFCVYPMLLEPTGMAGAPGYEAAQGVREIIVSGLSLWTLVFAVGSELMIGVVIGFGASLPIFGVQVGARVIDQQMGLGLAQVFNPEIGDNSGILDQIYFIMAMMIFLVLGGHRVMMEVLVGTFRTVPLGGYVPDGHLLDLVIGLSTSMLDLAMRVAGPLLCLIFLETVAMGFVARTVPQMNILSIGFPLRIVVGSAILVASVQTEAEVFTRMMGDALNQVGRYFGVY